MAKKKFKIIGRKSIHDTMDNNQVGHESLGNSISENNDSHENQSEIKNDNELDMFEEDSRNCDMEFEEKSIIPAEKNLLVEQTQTEKEKYFRARSLSPDSRSRTKSSISCLNCKQSKNNLVNSDRNHINILCQSKFHRVPSKAIILGITVAIFAIIFNFILSGKLLQKYNATKKSCRFDTMIERYPSENNLLWSSLKYGIEDILNLENPDGPRVFLFLRNSNSNVNHFVDDLATLTASCFDCNSQPITLKKNDFDLDDYGITIAKYKQNINDGGVLVVMVNLNEVPGKAARALHSICDKYTPIVKKVIIFLSLEIDHSLKGRPVELAEKILRDIWTFSLGKNELDPLIIRISDTVFRLQS